MNKNEKTALVPRLRFPGFSKEWKRMLFGKVFGFQQTNTFSRNQMNTQKGKVRNIHYGDVLIKYGYVLSDISTVPFVNEDVCLDKYIRNSYLQNGDVVIADTAEDLTAGKAIEIQNVNCDILAGLHTLLCRPNEQAAPGYWGYCINSPAYHNSIIPLITGSKVSSISKFNIVKTSVITTDFAEQQKIADCLSSLDDLIAAEDKKLEALKSHKKGLMQKLFPAEGETVPEWRFPEFRGSGEWNISSVGSNTIKVGSGSTPLGGENNYKKSGRPFIRSQNVGWGYLILDDVVYIDESTHQESASTEVFVGDVLLNITGASIGRTSVADYRVNGGNVNQHVCIIRTISDELSPCFLSQYFLSVYGQEQINSIQAGGNRQGLNFTQIRSFVVPLPSKIEEQQKIADFLSSADGLISEQTNKIDALKTYKKGLMQGLFPPIEEVTE